jgi:hypothetical protein
MPSKYRLLDSSKTPSRWPSFTAPQRRASFFIPTAVKYTNGEFAMWTEPTASSLRSGARENAGQTRYQNHFPDA